MFEAYTRTLRRIYWAEFVDAQLMASRPAQFRASIVEEPLSDTKHLGKTFEYHRHRQTPPSE
jgi:alpha-D-ribose 1-methylphosphonate 5-triphosphate synthase subunit PhnI